MEAMHGTSAAGFGLVYVVEHLIFAIIPAGLVALITPLMSKGVAVPFTRPRGYIGRSLLSAATGMLFLQLLAVIMWRTTSLGSDASFPAAILSLVASTLICLVLHSGAEMGSRSQELPLCLLAVTAVYDICASWQCFAVGHSFLAKVQFTIVLLKAIIVVLASHYSSDIVHPQSRNPLLFSLFYMSSIMNSICTLIENFLAQDLPHAKVLGDPEDWSNQFMRYWKLADQRSVSLSRACFHVFYWQNVLFALFRFCEVCLDFTLPFHLQYVVTLVQEKDIGFPEIKAVLLYTAIIHLGITFMQYATNSLQNRILTSTTSMLSITVHNKMLRLQSETIADCSLKSILCNDVNAVVGGIRGVHGLLARGFGVIFAFATLYRLMGYGCAVVLITSATLSVLASRISRYELSAHSIYREKLDAREKAIESIIRQLKNIKMMGLGDVLARYLERLAAEEAKAVSGHYHERCFAIGLASFTYTVNPAILLGTGWYLTKSLSEADAAQIFAIYMVTGFLTRYLTAYEFFYSEIHKSVPASESLTNFLLLEELVIRNSDENAVFAPIEEASQNHAIRLIDVTISSEEGEVVLQDVNLEIPRNTIAMTTWLAGLTIRQLILNGQQYVAERRKFCFYKKPQTAINEALSSVDSATVQTITQNLFGSGGLIHGWDCTLVMATNNRSLLRFADVVFEIKEDHGIWEHRDLVSFLGSFPAHIEVESDVFEPTMRRSTHASQPSRDSNVATLDVKHHFGSWLDLYKNFRFFMKPAGLFLMFCFVMANAVCAVFQELPPVFLAIYYDGGSPAPIFFTGSVAIGILAVLSMGATPINLVRSILSATPEFIANVDVTHLLRFFKDDFRIVSNDIHLVVIQISYMSLSSINGLLVFSSTLRYGFLISFVTAIMMSLIPPAFSAARKRLNRLQENALAALDSHITATEAGIEHIRAFGQVTPTMRDASKLIRSAQHYQYCISQARWRSIMIFRLWTSVLSCVIVALALFFREDTAAVAVGLALFFGEEHGENMRNLMGARAALEQNLESVYRIEEFCKTIPVERDEHAVLLSDPQWPPAGGMDFRDATITSESGMSSAGHNMKNATVSIEAGEKVGLAGYPDHGQSSVILAVLRMVNYTGNISIDGQDIKLISRELLRSKITTVTEDGIAIAGSVRLNLDPYSTTDDRFSDDDLISMLTRVHLWDIVRRRGGLDADISRMKFSKGHLQLLNLGRGALHKRRAGTRIVLIDEATSNLDVETEFQMSDFMDGEFAGATVLIVAQRLQCFETADAVLMMREGRVDSILRQDEDTGEWYEDFGQDEPVVGSM
ncbi:hypothetical protein NLG97_g2791 [Lecanicillium saksenae]|uniref:Uncharacterized protein n=1 Tax=Lecanicillium saksenae TaxID=468837 RepID=A0ACC1R164_9HYPO|nr:hypothetical protein NLG97_g2791 [Lecanicillium saksenae]